MSRQCVWMGTPLPTAVLLTSKIYHKCNTTKSCFGTCAWVLIYFATKQGPLPYTAHQAQITGFGTPQLSDLTADAQVNSCYYCHEVCRVVH